MKKLFMLTVLVLMAFMSHALVLNWTVLNDACYSDSFVFVQLVAINTSAGDDLPSELYSYYIELEEGGVSELAKGSESVSSMNLGEYMTVMDNSGELADDPVGRDFTFEGYSFYFRMLDENGLEMGRTTGMCGSVYAGPISWENVYEQYVLDAGHLSPAVWIVGIPEPCSAALMLLGASALIMRRRTA